jgi:hypothetical protein
MSAEVRHSVFSIPRSPQKILTDRLSALLAKIECRRADTVEEREAIFRLRYQAYLREGAISTNPSQRFTDADDDAENAYIFGLYVDGQLASSLRIHIGSSEHPDFPSLHVFPDVLQPLLDAGKVIIDSTRFVADEKLSRMHRGLPYATLRPCMLAAEFFHADDLLAAVRVEHQAFYQRAFNHHMLCEARPYPQLTKPISLMTLHFPTAADWLYRRYPFFRSNVPERRRLFERASSPGIQPSEDAAQVGHASAAGGNVAPFLERGRRCLAG